MEVERLVVSGGEGDFSVRLNLPENQVAGDQPNESQVSFVSVESIPPSQLGYSYRVSLPQTAQSQLWGN